MKCLQSLILIFFLFTNVHSAFAQSEKTAAPVESESSDYEVDYEEEPGAAEPEVPAVEVKPTRKDKAGKVEKFSKDTTSQGSRAEKKIAPLMKSETKSVYKKNGKALDVDTD